MHSTIFSHIFNNDIVHLHALSILSLSLFIILCLYITFLALFSFHTRNKFAVAICTRTISPFPLYLFENMNYAVHCDNAITMAVLMAACVVVCNSLHILMHLVWCACAGITLAICSLLSGYSSAHKGSHFLSCILPIFDST